MQELEDLRVDSPAADRILLARGAAGQGDGEKLPDKLNVVEKRLAELDGEVSMPFDVKNS